MKPVIAYVDDEIPNLICYKEILSDNFNVETYSRSLDVVKVLDDKIFDCFILDIYMPVMDGFQLLEKIRKHPQCNKTPVFFVSTNPCDEVKVNSFKEGAADFFDRLIKKEELIARLESRIKAHKESNHFIKLGNLSVDLREIDCYLNNKQLVLTLLEFKILSKLLQLFPNQVMKSDLVQAIWKDDVVNGNNLNSHLYNLRLKLDDWNYVITNHRFQGFSIKLKDSQTQNQSV